jgi:type I restriction enzyme S subunit
MDNDYLFYKLNRNKYFLAFDSGSGQTNLKKSEILACPVALPPTKDEQTAIATAIKNTDELIKQLEKQLIKKRNIKIGAMQELLNPKEDWEEKTLHQLADDKKELFDDGDWIEAEHITDSGIRIIQTGNIGIGCFVEKENKKYIFEKSFYKLKCKLLVEGDLLICRLAEPAGRACVLPNIGESRIVTSVDVTIFRPRIEIANRVFLANLFSTSQWFTKVIERVGGTTHKRISRSALGKISISLPKIEEQSRIAQILSDMDNEIREFEIKIEKYKMLRQGMMQSLLTGKIRL